MRRIDIPQLTGLAALAALCLMVGLIAGIDPLFAITVTVGLGFVLVTFASLTTGLSIFVVIVFLEFILPEGSLTPTKLAGLLLGLSWLALITTSGDSRRVLFSAQPVSAYLLGAFLGWATLSLFWATDMAQGLGDLSRYLLVFVLYVIVFTAVRDSRDAIRLIWLFIAGSAITAAYALIFHPTVAIDISRVSSTVGNANVLASILVAGFILALAAACAFRNSPVAVIGGLGTATLCVATLFLTGSRSGAIAFVVVLFVGCVVAGRWRLQVVIASVLVGLLVSFSFFALAPQEQRERVVEISPGQQPVDEGRTTLWQVAWRIVEDKPVQGVGVGNFQAVSKDYLFAPGAAARTDFIVDSPQVTHNIFLQIWTEMGIIGLLLFGAILSFSISSMWRAARVYERVGNVALEIMTRALIPAVVAILVTDFFASEQFNKLLWLLLGLGPALLAVASRELEAESPQEAGAAGVLTEAR